MFPAGGMMKLGEKIQKTYRNDKKSEQLQQQCHDRER